MKRWLSFLFFTLFSFAHAKAIPSYDMATYRDEIKTLYQTLDAQQITALNQRIAFISQYFLNRPYRLGPLGEGPQGHFDQNPLYRTDQFDCVTYVSTVIALAKAQTFPEFETWIKRIRYEQGVVRFLKRNHFISVDWNRYNTFTQDATHNIRDQQGKPIATTAIAIIDKPQWFMHLTPDALKFTMRVTPQQQKEKLEQLQQLGKQAQKERSRLLYLPLEKLYDKDGKPRSALFKQIPTPSIIEIVRPNWALRKRIGTNMQISHLGFAIRTPTGLMFREASMRQKKVVDIPLDRYLQNYLKSKTVKGIHIRVIR